ncbi:hypothetical protein NHH03_19605 [Stieleria sp. TO1_6]|uniref:hypothetical protein n=1 Tax=Stieleria tagensis TaxID=2956795 RepID=UPI00209AD93D|nr:hypothetical protein [Stieleria tagensis]MCO8123960.1 hypothetical protein [Stieleria tagensis]
MTAVSNSNQFLDTFAEVENWLRRHLSVSNDITFSKMVTHASGSNRVIRRYADDLREYAELRNAIVHDRSGGRVIAEPHLTAVRDFQQIAANLTNPPKLIPKFQLHVKTREISDSVGAAVSDMRAGAFSQIPVTRDGSVHAVLTAETVARWLASELKNEIVSLKETAIERVLLHTEESDHYCYLSHDQTMFDAIDAFEHYASAGKSLDAILISHGGQQKNKLLGIVTLFDLPQLLNEIGLKKISAT